MPKKTSAPSSLSAKAAGVINMTPRSSSAAVTPIVFKSHYLIKRNSVLVA